MKRGGNRRENSGKSRENSGNQRENRRALKSGGAYGLKAAFSKVNWRLTLTVVILTVVFTSVYQLCMQLEFKPAMWIYYAALIGLGAAYLVMNRGVSRKPPEPSELPDDWDDEKKAAKIAEITARKKKAKLLLIFIIPLLFSFLFETLYLFYLEPLINDIRQYNLLH